jgi:hypothetical protein
MAKVIKEVVYDLGGYDETKPDNNILETIYYTKDELDALAEVKAKADVKSAILDRIGLTTDELKTILG